MIWEKLAELSPSQIFNLLENAVKTKGVRSLRGRVKPFFYDFTGLFMGAYYGTPKSWKAIGYPGNVPLPAFDVPPQEVLDKLGLEQTVKD